ncbi:MAG: hypothetical protein ACOCRX_09740 [Candidatus Woesearchaeota archaeon]
MIYLIISFTGTLIIIGSIAAYSDLKKGIISNKLIKYGFLFTLILYLFFFFFNIFYLQSSLILNYLPKAFLNGFLCIFLGFMLWKFSFWSAGDGKLFGLYGFLLPLEFYSESYVNYFPSFALLVNLFIPLILVMLINFFIYLIKNKFFLDNFKKRNILTKKNVFKWLKNVSLHFTRLLLFVIIFSSLFRITEYLGIHINNIIIFLTIILFFHSYSKIRIENKKLLFLELVIISLFFARLIYQGNFTEIGHYFKIATFFIIVIVLLREVLLFYVDKKETVSIRAKEVQSGMVLTKKWRNYFSDKISNLNKSNKADHFKNLKSEGLTSEQAKIIRNLFDDDPKYKIKICKTLNFAPFLFLAAIISITTSNSFLTLIRSFMRNFIF